MMLLHSFDLVHLLQRHAQLTGHAVTEDQCWSQCSLPFGWSIHQILQEVSCRILYGLHWHGHSILLPEFVHLVRKLDINISDGLMPLEVRTWNYNIVVEVDDIHECVRLV